MVVLSLFDGISGGQLALQRAGIKVDKYYASEIDKYAIQITQKNFPDTIQLGDVTKIQGKDLPKIGLIIGGSPCFASGTKIFTKNGYKNIEDVVVGDYVLTHKKRYKKVLRVGHNFNQKTIVLNIQGIEKTEVTENHPYYVREMERVWDDIKKSSYRKFGIPIWKESGSLKKGDFIGFPILTEEENTLNITEEEAWIIGRYIADGHTAKNYRKSEGRPNDRHWQVILSIGKDKANQFHKTVLKEKYSFFEHTTSVYRAIFSSKRLVNIVEEHCGCGAKNKFLSNTLLNLPKPLLKRLLEGYISGDGNLKGEVYRVTSISSNLIRCVNLAIAKVYGTNSSFEYKKTSNTHVIEGRTVNQNDIYTSNFRLKNKKQTHAFFEEGYIWLPYKGSDSGSENTTVYNLEVEDDNSYTANNAIVHNCQGFSFAGKQLNFEDPRSALFFEFVRLVNECNPKYFLLENVKMKKEYQDVITEHLGVEPVEINSNLLSAQNRKRIYWTNIPGVTIPNDKGILLKDIVHENLDFETCLYNRNTGIGKKIDKSVALCASDWRGLNRNQNQTAITIDLTEYIVPFDKTLQILEKEVQRGKVGYFRKDSQANRVYYIHDKAVTLCGEAGGGAAKMGQYLFGHTKENSQGNRVYTEEEKSACLNASSGGTAGVGNILFGCITPDRVEKRQNGQRFNDGKKFYTLTAQDKHGILIEGYIRKLTPIECERLQTFPDNYTEGISKTQRYKALGNSFTVDVIAHILGGID